MNQGRGCGCMGGCPFCGKGGMVGGCECTGGYEGGCESSESRWLQIVIIVLLIYLIYRYGMENYVGYGLGTAQGSAAAMTSGATLRRLGTQFSSTNQGTPMTIYNADLPGEDTAMHVIVYPDQSIQTSTSSI
jgi:hypothetical protein